MESYTKYNIFVIILWIIFGILFVSSLTYCICKRIGEGFVGTVPQYNQYNSRNMTMFDSPSSDFWRIIGRAAPIPQKSPQVRIFSYYKNYSESAFPSQDTYPPVLRYNHWLEEDMTRDTNRYGHLYRIRDNNNQISILEGHQIVEDGEIRNIRPGDNPRNMIWKYKLNLTEPRNGIYWRLPMQSSVPVYFG